ncbi:MAG: alpha/beta hydrolase [Woeseiaceae bacterium]|nr:alpha/beta hydrolase [Woeseiaceae bacterium]
MAIPENAHYYDSDDGLRLYYRDFGADLDGTPVICLPGLTRNSRDFEKLAQRLARHPTNPRRVITPDFRGRGFSEHDPNWENYHPGTYIKDVWRLLDTLGINEVIIVGTSLGGLCAMHMSAENNDRIAGVVLNDVCPEINPAGLARVQSYTGRVPPVASWDEAAAQTKEIYGEWLPGLSDADWQEMARRAYRENADGVPQLDIDPAIGTAVRKVGAQKGDPWSNFATLKDTPVVMLWGVMSDIATEDIIDRMRDVKPDLDVVPVADRGHVPLLDEPECVDAIDKLLQEVA